MCNVGIGNTSFNRTDDAAGRAISISKMLLEETSFGVSQMPIEIRCPNPSCKAKYVLTDDLGGKTVKCRKCGTPFTVPSAATTTAATIEAAAESQKEPSVPYNPARQRCPKCGKVLGAATVVCPSCGTDIRQGVAREAEKEEKSSSLAKPIIAIVIFLLVIAGGIVFVWMNRGKISGMFAKKPEAPKKAAPEEPGKDVAKPPKPPKPEPDKKPAKPRPPRPVIKALKPEEIKIIKSIKDYAAGLSNALARLQANTWAELSEKARTSGLEAEALKCRFEALKLNPKGAPANRLLGRTQTRMGEFLTPAQAAFIDRLKPSLTVINEAYPAASVSTEGEEPVQLSMGKRARFEAEPGNRTLTIAAKTVYMGTGSLTVELMSATNVEIKLLSSEQLPALDEKAMRYLSAAVTLWSKKPTGRAWNKTSKGYEYRGRTVKFAFAVEGGELKRISVPGCSLSAPEGRRPSVVRNGSNLVIRGILSLQAGEIRIEGTEANPIVVQLRPSPRPARCMAGKITDRNSTFTVYSGKLISEDRRYTAIFSYKIEKRLNEALWNILELEDTDLYQNRSEQKVQAAKAELEEKVKELESFGKVLGRMHKEQWSESQIIDLLNEVNLRKALYEKSRHMPEYVDRAAALKKLPEFKDIDANEYEFLNWPQFSGAIGKTCSGAVQSEFLVKVDKYLEKAKKVDTKRRTPGRSRRPGRREPIDIDDIPPDLPEDNFPFYEGREKKEEDVVNIDEILAVCRIAPDSSLIPALVPLESVADEDVVGKVINIYERIGSPSAAARLSNMAKSNIDVDLRVKALLALGRFGRSYALTYCRQPFVDPAARTASLAALILSGDPQTFKAIETHYRRLDPESQEDLLDYIVQNDTPAKVLAIQKLHEKMKDEKGAPRAAMALARHGGMFAIQNLGEIIESDSRLYDAALRLVRPEETTPLIRPISKVMLSNNEESFAAALFLGTSDNPLAVDHLHVGAANRRNPAAAAGLAILGSADALKKASQVIGVLDYNSMKVIRRLWQEKAQLHYPWKWRSGVDTKAAKEFLAAALQKSSKPKVRLAAAFMIAEMGGRPDKVQLLKLAGLPGTAYGIQKKEKPRQMREPGFFEDDAPPRRPGGNRNGKKSKKPKKKKAPKAMQLPDQVVQNAQEYVFIGPEAFTSLEKDRSSRGRRRSGRSRSRRRPDEYEDDYEMPPRSRGRLGRKKTKEEPLPKGVIPFGKSLRLGSDPRILALMLLAPIADAELSGELQNLALKGETADIRVEATRLLGKHADEKSINVLKAIFAMPPKTFGSLKEMVDSARLRASAAEALGRAKRYKAAGLLAAGLNEAPPAKDAIKVKERTSRSRNGRRMPPEMMGPEDDPTLMGDPGMQPRGIAPDDYSREAARWRAVMNTGICKALGELCKYGSKSGMSRKDLLAVAGVLVRIAAYPGKGYSDIANEETAAQLAAVRAIGKMRLNDRSISDTLMRIADGPAAVNLSPKLRLAALGALVSSGNRDAQSLIQNVVPALMQSKTLRTALLKDAVEMAEQGGIADLAVLSGLASYLDTAALTSTVETILKRDFASLPSMERSMAPVYRAQFLFSAARYESKSVADRSDERRPVRRPLRKAETADIDEGRIFSLRRRCLLALADIDKSYSNALLAKLADNPDLGVEAIVLVAERNRNYPATARLYERASAGKPYDTRSAAVAGLRRLANDAAFDSLGKIMLGEARETNGGPRERHENFMDPEDEFGPGGPPRRRSRRTGKRVSSPDLLIAMQAARALATAGKSKPLREAFTMVRRNRQKVYKYSDTARKAAYYGYAYLPTAMDPSKFLSRRLRTEKAPELMAALNEALRTAKRREALEPAEK